MNYIKKNWFLLVVIASLAIHSWSLSDRLEGLESDVGLQWLNVRTNNSMLMDIQGIER